MPYTPPKLDAFHYHEVVDRAHVIQVMINELLDEHPVMGEHPVLVSAVRDLEDAASHVYQIAARISDKEFPPNG